MHARTRLGWFMAGLLLVALVTGCASKEVKPSPAAMRDRTDAYGARAISEWMPLNLGNTWTYERRFLGETGSLTVTVVSKDKEGFFVDNQGGRLMITPHGLRDPNRYLLVSPIETGKRWRVQVAPQLAEHFEVMDDNATVTVPAGKFEHCAVVRSTTHVSKNVRMVNTIVYAPKVGMVRNETRMENNQNRTANQVVLELTHYKLP